jgi:hypothetical protein
VALVWKEVFEARVSGNLGRGRFFRTVLIKNGSGGVRAWEFHD